MTATAPGADTGFLSFFPQPWRVLVFGACLTTAASSVFAQRPALLIFTVERTDEAQPERFSGASIKLVTSDGKVVATVVTDADGVAATRVAPGHYDAIASAAGYQNATVLVTAAPGEAFVRFTLIPDMDPAMLPPPVPSAPQPRGVISGRLLSMEGEPLRASVTFVGDSWQAERSTITADDGTFRVSVPIATPGGSSDFRTQIRRHGPPTDPRDKTKSVVVVRVADNFEFSTPIRVYDGFHTTGLELRVPTHPEYFVTITALNPIGNAVSDVEITMSTASAMRGGVSESQIGTFSTGTDGTATFGPFRGGRVAVAAISKGPDGYLAANTEIEIGDRRTDDTILQLRPAARLKGRVEFQGLPRPIRGPSPLRIAARLPEHSLPGYRSDDPNGMVEMDGSFILDGLLGERCLALLDVVPGWILQSITVNGRDGMTAPISFEPGQEITGVVFRVTPGSPVLSAPLACPAK